MGTIDVRLSVQYVKTGERAVGANRYIECEPAMIAGLSDRPLSGLSVVVMTFIPPLVIDVMSGTIPPPALYETVS